MEENGSDGKIQKMKWKERGEGWKRSVGHE